MTNIVNLHGEPYDAPADEMDAPHEWDIPQTTRDPIIIRVQMPEPPRPSIILPIAQILVGAALGFLVVSAIL